MDEHSLALSERVVSSLAGRYIEKGRLGMFRLHVHWAMRQHPHLFVRQPAALASAAEAEVRWHASQSFSNFSLHCSNCEEMLISSDPDNPLSCPECEGTEVEARSLMLDMILAAEKARRERNS